MSGRSTRREDRRSMTHTSSSSAVITGPAHEPAPEMPSVSRAPRLRLVAFTIGRKLISAVVVLWGAATVAFFAQLALPGDRATVILNIRAGQAQQRTPAE